MASMTSTVKIPSAVLAQCHLTHHLKMLSMFLPFYLITIAMIIIIIILVIIILIKIAVIVVYK